jgi:sugar lactone lactonase YvrE
MTLLLASCSAVPPEKPRLLVTLPDSCNTPDGMCLLPSGDIILSVPNVNDQSQPALLVKVTPGDRAEAFYTMPPGPKTGKAYPMGICVAPDGDLYVADNQWFAGPSNESRVLRIPVKDGKPGEAVVVATGFVIANGLAIRDGFLYVTDSSLLPDSKPLTSGVLRFKLGEEGVALHRPLDGDPHLVATLTTANEKISIGADGIAFDAAGSMYVGNFGDGVVHKFTPGPEGKMVPAAVFRSEAMRSADGLFYDKGTGLLLVADFIGNAIHAVSPDGYVRTLAANGDGCPKGSLDSPCETVVRNGQIIISNMDMPFGDSFNTKFERPAVLSALPLKK